MAILGKNGLYAGALYLAVLFGLYGMKDTSFKDSKEIDALEIILARKGKPDKAAIGKLRAGRLEQLLKSDPKRYKALLAQDEKTGKVKQFVLRN